ncbi:integrase arm-type DNA-binding domain-containing protein [Bordetella avium]|uniref:tyrosine-type recombinase/integrase n=1 Tax=Bordetella avium TaxID=521 RepID=UPI000E0CAAB5|nr:integrase arm-type DNA-binding domain-containing protein [Bordetella avium]RIQ11557.1 DUF4102 domain-containing protein [Bordetella avium]RIQ44944.1 DUF4102 domain-containing protein [Bordetella avium]RIQ49594.1 DUF4102 domain-containing protein [Bordetella avium]RIQ58439.1 DUF4102 domain-containing protein [Bordetella avium]RIQ59186.1 DUF4102 domain-containing protein [Bordetella avium]
MATKRVLQGLLTDLQIKSLTRTGEPTAKSDGGGLTFTLSKAGTASWVLRYRVGGRRRELTLGNYPDISLSDARRMAREKRVDVDQGIDPAGLKASAKLEAKTAKLVKDVIADYRSKRLQHLANNTIRTYSRQLTIVDRSIGARPIKDVTPEDIVGIIERRKANWTTPSGGWRETETLYIVIREIFKFAAGQRLITVNPAVGISLEAVIGTRPKSKTRLMLTPSELREVMNARMNRQNQLSIWILMATAVRVSELYTAKRENIFLDEYTIKRLGAGRWHIPASKMGPGIDIPLAPPVVEWFKELSSLALDSAYILPARTAGRLERGGGDNYLDENTIAFCIDSWIDGHKPDVRRFTPHDLRSTARSYLRALGTPRDIAEMCLNHKLRGVEGIYDQYTYWPERLEALTKLADFYVSHQGEAQATGLARNALRLVG